MNDVALEGYMEKCPQQPGAFKTWNKRWFVLRRAGSLGSARLEYYPDMNQARRQNSRRIIPLREVTAVNQTTHKSKSFVLDLLTPVLHYRFALPTQRDLDVWIDGISRVAFGDDAGSLPPGSPPPAYMSEPQNSSFGSFGSPSDEFGGKPPLSPPPFAIQGGGDAGYPLALQPPSQAPMPSALEGGAGNPFLQAQPQMAMPPPEGNPFLVPNQPLGVQENTLYSSMELEKRYRVSIIPTEASTALQLVGEYLLVISGLNITLASVLSNEIICVWPLKYLRRYGRDYTKFTFEAGRKCETGPGVFYFGTRLGNEIFHHVHNNVKLIGSQQHTSLRQADMVQAQPTQTNPLPNRPGSVRAPQPVPPAAKPRSSTVTEPPAVPSHGSLKRRFVQTVTVNETTSIPENPEEHFYETEDQIDAGSVKPVTPYDTLFSAGNGKFAIAESPPRHQPPPPKKNPLPREENLPKVVPPKPKRGSVGYDRLVLPNEKVAAAAVAAVAPDDDAPLYDDAELDDLMAGLAEHANRTMSPYSTLARDEFPTSKRKLSSDRAAVAAAIAASTAVPIPRQITPSKKTLTISKEEIDVIDSILGEMTIDDATIPKARRLATQESPYEMPPADNPPYFNVNYPEDRPNAPAAAGARGRIPYHNVDFPEEEGLGAYEDVARDQPGYINVTNDGEEDDEAYSEVTADDMMAGNRLKPSAVDDPAYGVPSWTKTAS